MKFYSPKNGKNIDFGNPIDISLSISADQEGPNAFFIPAPFFDPIKVDGFIGSVSLGGACNCENMLINAHGNGTHTECIGHITAERITINQTLKQFIFDCILVSVVPIMYGEDSVVTQDQIKEALNGMKAEAIVIRTLPNDESKKTKYWSGNNPTFLDAGLTGWLAAEGFNHLLVDLPSVDKESDNGLLAAHKMWWSYPENPRMHATITEMVYVSNEVPDGEYILNLQIAPLESDASPSKPILYRYC